MLVPRLLSIVILVTGLLMLLPIGRATLAVADGTAVAPVLWLGPMIVLATGAILIWMLTRRIIPLRLFALALALWVVTAGYLLNVSLRR